MNDSQTVNRNAAAKDVAAKRPAYVALMGTAATLLLLSANAFALPISPGTTLWPAPGELGGTDVLVDSMSSSFVANTATFLGELRSYVYQDASNPYGGLTFAYVVSNDVNSLDSIVRLALTGFGGYEVDASYQSPNTGVIAFSFNRQPNGNTIGATFGLRLRPGRESALLVLQTDANWYTTSDAFLIDGGVGSATIFAPTWRDSTRVPDNGLTATLLGFALCGLAWARRLFVVA